MRRGRGPSPRPATTARVGLAAGLVACLAAASTALPVAADVSTQRRDAVVEKRLLGRSVKGRPIVAYRLGDPKARVTAVAMSTMHGDEPRTRAILTSLRDGRPVRGLDLWVIPTANPDGLARGTRKNARGVDLNRNFPYRWAPLDGRYESGPGPASEPETKALMRFFDDVRPRYVVSFHQPLHGVDVSTRPVRTFARRLARGLDLPRKRFTCGGTCHGTFTMWYIHRHTRKAVTVEYGPRPSVRRMNVVAPRQLVRTLGGSFGR
jgi:murein peptide amidase A